MPLHQQFFSLPAIKTLSKSIDLIEYNTLQFLRITHPNTRAIISLQGAQLIFWQPKNEKNVIWLSEKSLFNPGTAIRGGVPICWPWFGTSGKPSHGFARNQCWSLAHHNENSNAISISLTLHDNDETRQIWDHPFTLTTEFTLSTQCNITLKIDTDIDTTGAFHSYFTIGDITQTSVENLGNHFIDKVKHIENSAPNGTAIVTQELDRIYTQAGSISLIHDCANQRQIGVQHHNMSDVVVWNPWAELSEKMADMENDSFKTMICVETARIHQPLSPQSQFGVSITLQK